MVVVAAGRGGGGAVKLVVRDSQARGRVVRDDEHAADERELVVVDPDAVVASLEIESVSAPHHTGIDVGELDALDDDILCVLGQRQALAFQDTLAANTQDGLVAANLESRRSSGIVGDGADGNVVIGGGARELAKVELTTVLHCLVCI